MTDVAAEVKDVVVEKEVEKPEKEATPEEDTLEKNGDTKEKDEGAENGDEKTEKVENGSVKENGVSDELSKDTKPEGEVCGIKRKSEVGLESSEDAAVETTDSKKQKVEETAEPEVASNGVC